MIAALTAADFNLWKAAAVSRQKKDALFDLACRIAVVAEAARASGSKAIADAIRLERRKTLRFGLELLSEGADADSLDQAFELEPVSKDLDPGTRLELALTRSGLAGIADREHHFVVFRRMTAFLGAEYFDKSSAWITERVKRRRGKAQTLLIPGDLPDLVRTLALDGVSLERALRQAGRSLASAALAGCPQESVDLARPCFGKIGGAVLEDDAAYLRTRLSGEEIAQAQAAFIAIVQNLEEGGEVEIGEEEELYNDPEYVKELSLAVLSLDERSLKALVKRTDDKLLATAMQGMEPAVHERILALFPKKTQRRILDAIDAQILLPRREIEEAGRSIARIILDTALDDVGGERLSRLRRVRDWGAADGSAENPPK
ncbi:MAG: hypothetical protein JNG85_08895 [Spirochaetaceae bacterium]|nr:hypothetical protein [Spirochaetaceae bacterium]